MVECVIRRTIMLKFGLCISILILGTLGALSFLSEDVENACRTQQIMETQSCVVKATE